MAFDLEREYKTDENKEVEGEKLFLDDAEESYLLVARMGNSNFKRKFEGLPRRIQIKIQNTSLSQEQQKQYLIPLIADTILVGWQGIGIGGEELEYNRQNAIRVLRDYPDFLQEVIEFAGERGNYLPEEEHSQEGNS